MKKTTFAFLERSVSAMLLAALAFAAPVHLVADDSGSVAAPLFVSYEAFGAVGDGVHDDLPAIQAAHAHANEQRLPVKSRPDAIYHLGRRALTAVIETDTDWSTSRFIIDDRDVENHKRSLFEVRSRLEAVELPIQTLRRDQQRIEGSFESDYFVQVEDSGTRRYIRRGLNQNAGAKQVDCFILLQDGRIVSPIDWDYDRITKVVARPIDAVPLTLKGGVFTTFANSMKQEVGYNYWDRNIVIRRSNTTIDGLAHYVAGETAVGHPYRGFLMVVECANVTLKNCFGSGHRVYTTIGNAGKPVPMGSYDFRANSVVNFSMINCRMNHLLDETLWGVIATNFCKNILIEDCQLSRMDAHMGVSGSYIIRRTTLGSRGLNAIGRGELVVEDSTLHGLSLISFRRDYGSTWEGSVTIRNCDWIPSRNGDSEDLFVFELQNDGQHNFGYPCYMPRQIAIDGLRIDDSAVRGNVYWFEDPGFKDLETSAFPYRLTESLKVRGLSLASSKRIHVSPNAHLSEAVSLLDWPSQ